MAIKQELDEYLNSIGASEVNCECPVKCALEIIGIKWKLRILAQLLRQESVRLMN